MAKIETIGAEQLRAVTGGFLGFRGPNGRFPILRGLFQQAAAGAGAGGGQAAGGAACAGGQCPPQG